MHTDPTLEKFIMEEATRLAEKLVDEQDKGDKERFFALMERLVIAVEDISRTSRSRG